MDLTNRIFKYDYPPNETRPGAVAAVRLDVLSEGKAMSGPLIDTYWHGAVKFSYGGYAESVVMKQHQQSDDTVEVVDINLSMLPPGTQHLRLYVYNLRPREEKG
jgi:hypothetical protein